MDTIDIARAEEAERRLAFYGLSEDADEMAENATRMPLHHADTLMPDDEPAAGEARLNYYGLTAEG